MRLKPSILEYFSRNYSLDRFSSYNSLKKLLNSLVLGSFQFTGPKRIGFFFHFNFKINIQQIYQYVYYYIKHLSNEDVHFLSWYSNFHNTHFILPIFLHPLHASRSIAVSVFTQRREALRFNLINFGNIYHFQFFNFLSIRKW
jgi:hypothetical protein